MMADYEKYIQLKNSGLVSLTKNTTMPGFILTFNRFDSETGDQAGTVTMEITAASALAQKQILLKRLEGINALLTDIAALAG